MLIRRRGRHGLRLAAHQQSRDIGHAHVLHAAAERIAAQIEHPRLRLEHKSRRHRIGRRRDRHAVDGKRRERRHRRMAQHDRPPAGAVSRLDVDLRNEPPLQQPHDEAARRGDDARNLRIVGRGRDRRRAPCLHGGESREIAGRAHRTSSLPWRRPSGRIRGRPAITMRAERRLGLVGHLDEAVLDLVLGAREADARMAARRLQLHHRALPYPFAMLVICPTENGA
jgi:hypothetical protein